MRKKNKNVIMKTKTEVKRGRKMKVVVGEEKAFKKSEIVIYITILLVCIISIVIAFYVQFYARIDIGRMLGFEKETSLGNKTEEQIEELKVEFDQLFINGMENTEGQVSKKQEADKALVYTKTQKKESKLNSYDVEVNIPYINIDNPKIEEYNQEIGNFEAKANDVLNSENRNSIYTVEYVANVQDDILSLMIRSNLKEGSSAQRVIIETFNYDLRNNKEISLEEVLRIRGLDKEKVQEKIKGEIAIEQKKVEDLKNLGYNIYSRNVSDSKYQLGNTKEFYLTDSTLYIAYPYGNETFTSEMDLVII